MSWPRLLHWAFAAVVFAGVAMLAWWNRGQIVQALRLMGDVSPWLMLVAAAAMTWVFVSRGCAYRIALVVMGHSFRRGFLALTALVATTAHHLIPTAGASGYAVLTYVFHQHGVAAGRASMLALVDTSSNAVALASLVIVVLVYLAAGAPPAGARLAFGLLPGVGLLAAAAFLYYLQRDRERLLRLARRCSRALARSLGKGWDDAPIDSFVDQYYQGKRLITRNPGAFLRMVAWQYAAVLGNCVALYAILQALGALPTLWVLFTALVLAMAGVSVVAAPAGAGSFEVVMSGFFILHGMVPADAIAATLLYRLVAFWLPLLVSVPVVVALRRRRGAPADPRRLPGG